MTTDDDRTRRLALAALAVDEPEPAPGERPSVEELWDWMAGEIDAGRAEEIRAHVARDPDVHERWRQLRLALDEDEVAVAGTDGARDASPRTEHDARGTASGWLGKLGEWLSPAQLGGAFAAVAVLGIAIGIGRREAPPAADLWQDWQVPKSTGVSIGSEERPELEAFLVGVHDQMRDLSLEPVGPERRPLPDRLADCDGADAVCAERRERLRELGRLSVLSRWQCVLGTDEAQGRQERVGEILFALEDESAAGRLIGPLRAWADADSTRSRCGAIGELIARGLAANDRAVR